MRGLWPIAEKLTPRRKGGKKYGTETLAESVFLPSQTRSSLGGYLNQILALIFAPLRLGVSFLPFFLDPLPSHLGVGIIGSRKKLLGAIGS
jgi:hypothetical protein